MLIIAQKFGHANLFFQFSKFFCLYTFLFFAEKGLVREKKSIYYVFMNRKEGRYHDNKRKSIKTA